MLPVAEFNDYIKQHALFGAHDKLLLAVSGGRDSVLMAHFFKQAGYDFSIAHCNFNLREDESQRDETFVRLLATSLEVPFFLKQFDTKAFAADERYSTQMAARKLRYDWFSELAAEQEFDAVALAHHQNDVVETMLINLVRGTGISGLHGIAPKADKWVRPMLFLTGEDIAQLVEENGIAFVEDSSNLSTHYIRNKIRHLVVPHLREINPSLERTFLHNIQRFAETESVLHQAVMALRNKICEQTAEGFTIAIAGLKAVTPQKLLLFELLKPYQFTETDIASILEGLDKQSGTSWFSSSHRATINRDQLLITPVADEHTAVILWHSNTDEVVFNGRELRLTITGQLPWQFDPSSAYVDHERLIFPLILRNWQQGDTFIPLGMQNHKKLSDFFIDNKVPLPVKSTIPILLNGNSEVIWIAGLRQDDRYKVDTSTKKVAIFELHN